MTKVIRVRSAICDFQASDAGLSSFAARPVRLELMNAKRWNLENFYAGNVLLFDINTHSLSSFTRFENVSFI